MFYELPNNLTEEINQLEKDITSFLDGSLNPVKFRGIRVPFGVYEQRQANTYMLRVRCPGGAITPTQFNTVAQLAQKYGSGRIHITTRQEAQIHDLLIVGIIPIMKGLLKVGLSSRGGGGNTVRNIMASYDSGVKPGEVFDVLPYASALTTRLISEGASWSLPRKYKITLANGPGDNANATIQDLGFVAKIQNGVKGFAVYVAGGMGAKPLEGQLLYDFVRDDQVYNIAVALRRLFDQHGNRRNKHAARLRFTWWELGKDRFVELFEEQLKIVQNEELDVLDLKGAILELKDNHCSKTGNDQRSTINGKQPPKEWLERFVEKQKQPELYSMKIPLKLGDISSEEVNALCDLLVTLGDDVIRFSMDQNIYLRNIKEEELSTLYNRIVDMFPLTKLPVWLSNTIACAGASTCKLGICLPRGAVDSLYEKFSDDSSGDYKGLKALKIHLSGCPNSCGQHWIADLGFFGKAGRKDGQAYPAYNVCVGAVTDPGRTKLAETIATISAYDIPALIKKVTEDYSSEAFGFRCFADYLEASGSEKIKNWCSAFEKEIPTFQENKNYYYDWGADEVFSIEKLGQGECTAGLFDMIDVDKNLIKVNRDIVAVGDGNIDAALYNIVFSSSRMLLVTKGLDARTDSEVLDSFRGAFISTGLIAAQHVELIELTKNNIENKTLSVSAKENVLSLASEVISLYEQMDNSLRFPGEGADGGGVSSQRQDSLHLEEPTTGVQGRISIDKQKDYRGVACPMNFVKTKLDLSMMTTGQVLEILLDDGEPMENVPRSVEGEGHTILEQVPVEGYWRVVIEKG